jgi:hypothetical protein
VSVTSEAATSAHVAVALQCHTLQYDTLFANPHTTAVLHSTYYYYCHTQHTHVYNSVEGQRLPTTGQVAAQQGAFVARLLNRGYVLSEKEPVAPSVARTGPTEWGGLDMVRHILYTAYSYVVCTLV